MKIISKFMAKNIKLGIMTAIGYIVQIKILLNKCSIFKLISHANGCHKSVSIFMKKTTLFVSTAAFSKGFAVIPLYLLGSLPSKSGPMTSLLFRV